MKIVCSKCGNDKFETEIEKGRQLVIIHDDGTVETLDTEIEITDGYHCIECGEAAEFF